MSNTFEGMFRSNHETTGSTKNEAISAEFKREAVEAVIVANIIEPLAFQLGAVKMANIILQSEQQGVSRNWMFWLNDKDIAEIEEKMFSFKNKVHSQHEVISNPKTIREQNKMYDLFKNYGHRGANILTSVEHHLGHILNASDIREILEWIEQRRSIMSAENTKYREMLKSGEISGAQRMLEDVYKTLYADFQKSNLYSEKFSKIESFYSHMSVDSDFYRGIFNHALHDLFLETFNNI